jgi:fluoride exporter
MAAVDARELAAIFAGGAIGTTVRAALADWMPSSSTNWPTVTFAVNVVGAFMLGYVATRLQERLPLSSYRRPLLGTGLCGGLTTFSTMQLEIVRMLDGGAYLLAAAYIVASIVAGLLAVHTATALVRRVRLRG